MRFPTTKIETTGNSQNLPLPIFVHKPPIYDKPSSTRDSNSLFQRLFKVFNKKERLSSVNNKKSGLSHSPEIREPETRSLLDLENCANVARETEAYGQYEWINEADE